MNRMRIVSVVLTGRADASPLAPLMAELRKMGVHVRECCIDAGRPWAATEAVERHIDCVRPDVMVILGDRWESLAAAYAATYNRIPIAHIHGGEITRGSFDNQIRNAITKLSHLHFVATVGSLDVVFDRLGEEWERIYLVGTPGMDRFVDMPPRVPEKKFVVTWHPVTLCPDERPQAIIDALLEFPDYEIVWTSPNNDPGERPAALFTRLTPDEYIAHCRTAAAIVGNSSSGIIEAPYMQVPSVNIGSRQEGRESGPSVVYCQCDRYAIELAIRLAVAYAGPYNAQYGGPGASAKIARVLADVPLEGILVK